MKFKFEIKRHDGPGRMTKVYIGEKTIISPNFVDPYEFPPIHRDTALGNQNISVMPSTNNLTVGYLPRLHYFSTFSSGKEVVECLKDKYYDILKNTFDFVFFPIDPAHSHREFTQYPKFIQKVTETLTDLTFGWVYPYEDQETYWNMPKSDIIILGDLSRMLTNPRKMWSYISTSIEKFPLALKYAPAIPPVYMPLFTYLGIDFFDKFHGKFLAQSNIFLDWTGEYKITSTEEFVLRNQFIHGNESDETKLSLLEHLATHNQQFTEIIMRNIQLALSKSKLRDLVKQTVLSYPSLTALLRIADNNDLLLLEKYTPSFNPEKLLITGYSDFSRPEVLRYQQMLINRFTVPDWTEIVILLPCSAKKPYSESRSHRLFSKAIKAGLGGARFSIVELIITSPLGIVPRFWEKVYPAGYYDIAVTGDWVNEEKIIIQNLLEHLIPQINRKIPILTYVHTPEKTILEDLVKNHPEWPLEILPLVHEETHPDSLKLLTDRLKELKNHYDFKGNSKNNFLLEYFRAMADYQFGKLAGNIIFPADTRIKWRPHQQVAFLDKQQLASIKNLGQLRLTIAGAHRLATNPTYQDYSVTFAEDSIQGSAIYTPGIVDADEKIRPEDDVFIFSQNKSFLGLGKAHLSGSELVMSNYGLGVSIRKKYRN